MALAHSFMPFLRPLGPPQPSTFCRFMKISTIKTSQNEKAEAESAQPSRGLQTRIKTTVHAAPSDTAARAVPSTPISEPYTVHRTSSRQLPIYLNAKRGGNLHQTQIKKIEGDVKKLRDQLQEHLQLPPKDIVVNQLTRHILIKGWRKPEIIRFLEERQF